MAETKNIFGSIAIICLFVILFTPQDSKAWIYFLIIAIIFAVGWFIKKE